MASLVFKKSRGHSYAYWVRSARVNGKPRIVEQVYLGTKDRFLEELKLHFTRGKTPGPTPLKQLRVKEFGASAWLWHWAQNLELVEIVDRHVPGSAWLWHWAQNLELVEIVDRHVPGVDKKRRTPLSVGQYLLIAALNRAVQASSKRALYTDWYQDSVVSRLCPAQPGALTSQRFWDHMDQVEPDHIEAMPFSRTCWETSAGSSPWVRKHSFTTPPTISLSSIPSTTAVSWHSAETTNKNAAICANSLSPCLPMRKPGYRFIINAIGAINPMSVKPPRHGTVWFGPG